LHAFAQLILFSSLCLSPAAGQDHLNSEPSRVQSRPKGLGSALPSVAQGKKPGTRGGGNKGFQMLLAKLALAS
jgi:hypothetical protein